MCAPCVVAKREGARAELQALVLQISVSHTVEIAAEARKARSAPSAAVPERAVGNSQCVSAREGTGCPNLCD